MITELGDKFLVKSKDGTKLLGTHRTKKGALKQMAAIEINKKKKSDKKSDIGMSKGNAYV